MMNKINQRLNGASYLPHSANENIPRFTFPPVDLSGSKAFQDACLKLWEKGMVSNETLLQTYGYDMGQEVERRKSEEQMGITNVLVPPVKVTTTTDSDNTAKSGRPTLDDSERHSDPAKSVTGRQPKGSNPEGSEEQEQ